jgi:ABC-type polysaccharide/polyol phosphate transport system ATPase subunit
MKKPIINVDNVTICYKAGYAVSYKTIFKNLFKKKDNKVNKPFEAVKNVSFTVQRGETVGIVGENGSGKSTLLRALVGIYHPDKGEVKVDSEKVSLLALGIGFQSRLTGYQNIFLSGYAMGFKKQEIERKLDEIIEFSELGEFIYKPVKTYSSGMYSKLAFAISSTLSTGVLLIDEVLSVGDIRFQRKSQARIMEMINDKERSVVIVSHSDDVLREICNKIVWLHKGELKMFGEANEVLDAYTSFMRN